MSLYPKSANRLIDQLSKLPGVGRITAQRLAFYILKSDEEDNINLSDAIQDIKQKIIFCEEEIEFISGRYLSNSDIEDTQMSQFGFGINFHNKGSDSPFSVDIGGRYRRTNYENYNSTHFVNINIDEDAEEIYSNAGIIDISIYEPIFQKGKLILIPSFNFNYEIRVITSSDPDFPDEFDKSSEARLIGTSFGLGLKYDKYFLETTLNETEGLSYFWFKIGKLFHAKRKK